MTFEIKKWNDISNNYTGALLLGNGASIAISDKFSYTSLIEHARENGILTDDVQKLFDFFETNDFELILRLVWQASNVNKSLHIPDEKTHNAYLRVRESLIRSVRSIHPDPNSDIYRKIPEVYKYIKRFKTILSLNYDITIYWAITYGLDVSDNHVIKDCFINGEFNDDWKKLSNINEFNRNEKSNSLVFYPHGNLILIRNRSEVERKIKLPKVMNGDSKSHLLASILDHWEQENCIPIFVSEGTSKQKIESIKNSYYLSTVYREVLTSLEKDLTIYGWSFGDHDLHILERISKSNIKKVAVSVYKNDQAFCNRVSQMIKDNLGENAQIDFFDSASDDSWINSSPPF